MIGYGVLIPRPETELMAEHAINIVKSQKSKVKSKKTEEKAEITNDGRQVTVLDLCTGSGCLALALAKELPHARVCGSDISETAISYAVMNARINGVENVSFLNGHLFDPLGSGELYDVIISNPPYIRTDEIETLQPEVRDWEPLNALDGGPDGLVFYREIIPAARKFLKDSGMLMLELGAGCARDVAQMMKDAGYRDVEIRKDYSGIKRIIQAQWTR
jgi:release factor glutamine methyltransferase